MKKLLPLLLACVLPVSAVEYWATGVSLDSGWYDANKTFAPEDGDTNLCWAASAANIITWWQREHIDLMEKCGVSEDLKELDTVWRILRDSFQDAEGAPAYAMEWYFLDLIPIPQLALTDYGKTQGGYYRNALLDYKLTVDEALSMVPKSTMMSAGTDVQALSLELRETLAAGRPCSLSLGGEDLAHSATLWGAAFDDETGLPTTLYLTESDDGALRTALQLPHIFTASVDIIEATPPDATDPMQVLGITSYLVEDMPWYPEGTYIVATTSLGAPYPFPEPATGALSLLGLGLLAGRRRKRK